MVKNNNFDKHIIVTGATGFVGRNIVKNLIKNKFKVSILVRNLDKALSIDYLKDIPKIYFDIERYKENIEVPKNITLIHCAWSNVKDTHSLKHIEENYINNYFFIKNMINKGIDKIVITGTCFEYGLQQGSINADAQTKPNDAYSLAKDNLHKSLRLLQNKSNFNLIWLRLFYMYGEGQNKNSIIPLFDAALERGDEIFNMSPGDQLLDYLNIDEVSQKIIDKLDMVNGTFNICKGEPILLRNLLKQRMKEKEKYIKLNMGYYDYRKDENIRFWGKP
tara:strand:+ start:647 stop:1477 length:831 start_codon:yes stop_codon:yes gene_type:complete